MRSLQRSFSLAEKEERTGVLKEKSELHYFSNVTSPGTLSAQADSTLEIWEVWAKALVNSIREINGLWRVRCNLAKAFLYAGALLDPQVSMKISLARHGQLPHPPILFQAVIHPADGIVDKEPVELALPVPRSPWWSMTSPQSCVLDVTRHMWVVGC